MHMRSFLRALLLLAAASACAGSAFADVVYITDQLWVRLRATPTEDARTIHAGLPSGTELELLGHDLESGFSHVRMSDGREGWIPTQYLVTKPIAKDRLDVAERKLAEIQRGNTDLASQVDTLNRENVELRQHNEELTQQAEMARRAADASGETGSAPVILDPQSKVVAEMNGLLRREVDELVEQNQALQGAAEQRWMLTGVGLLAIGLAIGAFVTRRRRSW